MIRIRVKPAHVTVRIGDGPKQRYASAIQALHVIRVAVVEDGLAIEGTQKTQAALDQLVRRSQVELDAAIGDVTKDRKIAICVHRGRDNNIEQSYYQTTDQQHLYVMRHESTAVFQGGFQSENMIKSWTENISADEAIRRLGYAIAPV